jgi:malate synthase
MLKNIKVYLFSLQDYELKLHQSLQEIRAQNEAQLNANKAELKNAYDTKYSDLKSQLNQTRESFTAKTNNLQLQLNASSLKMTRFEKEKTDFIKKIKELENQNKDLENGRNDDYARFHQMLNVRDGSINVLMEEKACLMSDYEDLIDTKVKLDNEIITYQQMLETEEKRWVFLLLLFFELRLI